MLSAFAPDGKAMAAQLLADAIADYRANGTMECVNHKYHGVADYVDTATNTYGACLRLRSCVGP